MTEALKIDRLTKQFGLKTAVDNVSFIANKGEVLGFLGPNGAGKSILLECLMGTFMPDKGEIDKKNNLSIGYIPQNFNPDNSMPISVSRFLMLRKNFTPKELKSVSDETNISDVLSKNLSNLSGGELQRVLLARSLLGNPELLILDEPAQNLDIKNQLNSQNVCSICSSNRQNCLNSIIENIKSYQKCKKIFKFSNLTKCLS